MPKPLAGKRVVVTRSPAQAASMCRQLAALGATPIAFPAIQFAPLPPAALDAALARLDQYDWLVLTSGNAVRFFFERAQPEQVANQPRLKVAASGSATAKKLNQLGLSTDFIPDEFVGEALVAGLGDLTGRRVLLPRARQGRPKIVALLQAQGGDVDDIPLYDTITAVPTEAALAELQQGFDVVTFTSPSSVRNFLKILDKAEMDKRVVATSVVACIGPITAEEAERFGLPVQVMPSAYTIDGLVTAVAEYFRPS